MDGERGLLLAIIVQSVRDLSGHALGARGAHKSRVSREARAWIESERYELGSFAWICQELDLSSTWLRRELLALVSNGEKVSVVRTRKMDQGGRGQHDDVALGLYDQEQRYGGR
jgi:hypothetical protein